MFGHGFWAAIWLLAANNTVLGGPNDYFLMAAGLLVSLGVARRFERR